jgi:hypothetical protein
MFEYSRAGELTYCILEEAQSKETLPRPFLRHSISEEWGSMDPDEPLDSSIQEESRAPGSNAKNA